ncbi:MAG TPA: C39 family peptidase [Micromonosporaceae bacterium]|nr:C39 family peptidase [Micromonosporaceae bacterium]
MNRRTVLRAALAAGAVAAAGPATTAAAADAKKPTQPRNIAYRAWTTSADFATGTAAGTVVAGDAVSIGTPIGQLTYTDPHTGRSATYDYATWTSPVVIPGFAASELIPSWTAATPGGTWLQIELRGLTVLGETTKWYNLGRWAADDNQILRTSVPAQGDANGYVAIDTFVAASGRGWTRWELRATLYRPVGSTDTPTLRSVGAAASLLPEPGRLTPSVPGTALGVVLNVPQYSQEIHAGEYPQWDGGGEAWCSPTSTSMVVAYWGTGPTPADYAWVDPSYADPWVDYAARNTYDYAYQGCGNWPYNTAYAGRFGLDGFVTRLRSMNETELFIAAGIPLVVSASFKKGQIPGLDYGTNGHLMVVVGFTTTGQVVMNDPFSPSNAAVRKIVGRAEYEEAWLNTSRGVVYVIKPPSVALPPAPQQPNW